MLIQDNGGDGLVASRYLKEYNLDVDIYYPKEGNKEIYGKLKTQCIKYGANLIDELDLNDKNMYEDYDLIIDSIFGFSFKGELRAPFDEIIKV